MQIAEAGSLSAAAHILHIAQPALSRQMRAFEAELGVPLFLRTGRGVILTPAGHELASEGARLIEQARALQQRIRGYGSSVTGEATIGLSPTLGRVLTLPLANYVRAEFPHVKLRIAEAFSGTLLEWLQNGRVDAAILYHSPASAALRCERIAEEPLWLIGNAHDQRFPTGAGVTISALSGMPLVLSTPHHGLRAMVDAHARAAGAHLDVIYEFDSLEPAIALVKEGMALTILPIASVRREIEAGILVGWPIVSPELIRPLVVCTAAQRGGAIGMREVAGILRHAIEAAASNYSWRLCQQRHLQIEIMPSI